MTYEEFPDVLIFERRVFYGEISPNGSREFFLSEISSLGPWHMHGLARDD
jgi:hypothetical protein